MSRGSATALVRRPKRRFIKPRLSSWRYEAGGLGFLAAGYTIKLLDALNDPGARPVDAGGRPVDVARDSAVRVGNTALR